MFFLLVFWPVIAEHPSYFSFSNGDVQLEKLSEKVQCHWMVQLCAFNPKPPSLVTVTHESGRKKLIVNCQFQQIPQFRHRHKVKCSIAYRNKSKEMTNSILWKKSLKENSIFRSYFTSFFVQSFGTNPRHIRKSDELINY